MGAVPLNWMGERHDDESEEEEEECIGLIRQSEYAVYSVYRT